jgi:hypothetical protein
VLKGIATFLALAPADQRQSPKVKGLNARPRLRDDTVQIDLPGECRAFWQRVTRADGTLYRSWYWVGTHEAANNYTGTGK